MNTSDLDRPFVSYTDAPVEMYFPINTLGQLLGSEKDEHLCGLQGVLLRGYWEDM